MNRRVVNFRLLIIKQIINFYNFILLILNKIFFKRLKNTPKNIIIYKIGNIGDIVCAIPSFIAIRKSYPNAKITLLTSPGKKGSIGAKELLDGVRYLDKLEIYYSEDIDSFSKKIDFLNKLKKEKCDLFIQLPDDLAGFMTILRNIIFAKLIGVKSAYGFKIRTIQLFKKVQVYFSFQKTEVESLLEILEENGVKVDKVEFDFNISSGRKNKVEKLLKKNFGIINKKEIIVAISPGGKREGNRWPIERFAEIANYLSDKYGVRIIIVGGKNDILLANTIKSEVKRENIFIAAGELDILETIELLKYCSFLISNSTGTMHLAAAVGIPVIGLFTIRDVFGRWFPYGQQHKILFHKFLDCDYKKEKCIKNSLDMISINEVKNSCDFIISNIKEKE